MRGGGRQFTHHVAVALGVIFSALAACNGSGALVPVAGRVVFNDGVPVSFGVIEFVPRGGGAAARSSIDRDGRFVLKTAGLFGALGGDHDVYVMQPVVVEGVESHVHRRSGAGLPLRLVHARHGRRGESDLAIRVDSATADQLVITVHDSTVKH